MQRIVIVGGGVGGTMLANLLVVRLYPEILGGEVQVLLISDSPDHYYKPAFMYVAFEQFFLEDLKRPQRSLLRPEVMFQLDRVDRFDFPRQEVFITVSFPRTPNVPHQCGIAPVETTLMLDDYLRRRGVRERVEIVYTYPTTAQLLRNCLFLQRPTCEILPSLFEQRGIRFQRGFTLARVDPERRIAYSEEGDEQPFDLLMATPPIHAVDAVRECGLSQAAADEGWLPTNHETLQVYGVDRVYTLGDTVDLPVSKAGGACHNQAPVVASNIAAEIRLGKPCAIYDGRVQAVAQMGLNAGMPLWYDYRHDVKPTPPTKLGGLLRQGFNRGLYWAVARGML